MGYAGHGAGCAHGGWGYVAIQCWSDTQRRALAEPTLVRRVFLCTVYDALMKRVCVRNNVRWVYDTMR